MLKEVSYNQPSSRKEYDTKYSEEHRLIYNFLESEDFNMTLEYDCGTSAKQTKLALRHFIAKRKIPVVILGRGKYIIIEKKGEEKDV